MATVNYIVTVATGTPHPLSGNQNPTGNVYFIDGSEPTSLSITRGDVIRFDLSDPSNAGHDLRVADSTSVYTDIYTPGFYVNGEAGQPGAYVEWTVPSDTPNSMFVFCYQHGLTMGFDLSLSGTSGVKGTYEFNVEVVQGPQWDTGTTGDVFEFTNVDGGAPISGGFSVTRGIRYVFNQFDTSNIGHLFEVFFESVEGSGTYDKTWSAGITDNGGSAGVDLTTYFQAPLNTPSTLLYACEADGPGSGGIATVSGSNGVYVTNPDTLDPNAADLQNPVIDSVTFAQQYYTGALRYNNDLHRYEFFNDTTGWVQTTYAPTVNSWEGEFNAGEINSIVINGGGFDPQMIVKIVSADDIYTILPNPITYTYISPTRAAVTIDTSANYPLQDGTGAILRAIRFKLTSGVTGAAGVSGEIEVDRDPEFGVAPLTTIGQFYANTTFVGETAAEPANVLTLSAIDPDDENAVITFSVAPNTMGFGTNRNLTTDGGAAGTAPNEQNNAFSVWFEYQEPNQGILRGSVNPWSNGGPGHPDYGTQRPTSGNERFPGKLNSTHTLTVRATSTAPDGRVTENDETFTMRVIQPWKHIANISHHYVFGGYIGAESWRVVHRCDASTDTTIYGGIGLLASNGVTTPNTNRSGARYSSEAIDRWSGQAMILRAHEFGGATAGSDNRIENYNMITATAYGVHSILSHDRHDLQGFSDDSRRKGYAVGGYNTATDSTTSDIDKINLTTNTREAVVSGSSGGYGAATAFTETTGYHHQWGRSTSGAADGGYKFTFATDTAFGSFSFGSLGYAGAVGKAMTTWNTKLYWIGYNVVPDVWTYETTTDTLGLSSTMVQTSNNGEGNISGGLAHGYSLGAYNGTQNNHADRFNYSSETCVRVSAADTTGNAGSSSAGVGWVEL